MRNGVLQWTIDRPSCSVLVDRMAGSGVMSLCTLMEGYHAHRPNTQLMCDPNVRRGHMRCCPALLGDTLQAQDHTGDILAIFFQCSPGGSKACKNSPVRNSLSTGTADPLEHPTDALFLCKRGTESQAELTEHDRILDGLTGPGLLSMGTADPLEHPTNASLLCKGKTEAQSPFIGRWYHTR